MYRSLYKILSRGRLLLNGTPYQGVSFTQKKRNHLKNFGKTNKQTVGHDVKIQDSYMWNIRTITLKSELQTEWKTHIKELPDITYVSECVKSGLRSLIFFLSRLTSCHVFLSHRSKTSRRKDLWMERKQ